jgi:hypothetical protein
MLQRGFLVGSRKNREHLKMEKRKNLFEPFGTNPFQSGRLSK